MLRRLLPMILAIAAAPAHGGIEKDALDLVARGKHVEAATRIGKALAQAHKANDLRAEQRLWNLARKIDDAEARRAMRAALMQPLEPARGGAFVSAHLLAKRLVFACIEAGDDKHLDAAIAVLAARARARGAGRHVALVHQLAIAVEARGKGAADVCVQAGKSGWPELAGMAAIATFQGEGAARGDAKRAEDAVVAILVEANDSALAIAWAQPIKSRLAANAHAVSAVTRVMRKVGAIPVQILGNAPAGGSKNLEKKLRRFGSRKPLASVQRRASLQVVHGFENYKTTLPPRAGVKLHAHGGLVLALNRFGVAIRRLDVDGEGATRDDSEVPGPFDLMHRLAEGESWILTKRGVEIRP